MSVCWQNKSLLQSTIYGRKVSSRPPLGCGPARFRWSAWDSWLSRGLSTISIIFPLVCSPLIVWGTESCPVFIMSQGFLWWSKLACLQYPSGASRLIGDMKWLVSGKKHEKRGLRSCAVVCPVSSSHELCIRVHWNGQYRGVLKPSVKSRWVCGLAFHENRGGGWTRTEWKGVNLDAKCQREFWVFCWKEVSVIKMKTGLPSNGGWSALKINRYMRPGFLTWPIFALEMVGSVSARVTCHNEGVSCKEG